MTAKRYFQYKCKECSRLVESDSNREKFDCCGKKMVRVYSLGGVILKGSGFYSTDKDK